MREKTIKERIKEQRNTIDYMLRIIESNLRDLEQQLKVLEGLETQKLGKPS